MNGQSGNNRGERREAATRREVACGERRAGSGAVKLLLCHLKRSFQKNDKFL